jgi:hypothetical protein
MLATLGLLVTLAMFARLSNATVFVVLGYVFAFGVLWDVLWITLQKLRWDRDWPAAFQVGTAIIEGIWLYAILSTFGLPMVARGAVTLSVFAVQYGLVWLLTFLWVQGPMRVVAPRWRYQGGRLV